MGCRKCAERRKAEAVARAKAKTAKKEADRLEARKAYELASAWHVWGWRFIHRFTLALPPGVLDATTLQHMRRVVQLFIEVLPCKDCQGHATAFMTGGARPRLGRVKTGQALAILFYELHNDVNHRTKKPQPGIDVLNSYRTVDLREAYTQYVAAVRRESPVPAAALDALEQHMAALRLQTV